MLRTTFARLRNLSASGFAAAAAVAISLAAGSATPAWADVDSIRLDYAYYSPVSLVLKDKGWIEEEFKKDGIEIRWVQSHGSNKALEFLNAGAIEFGSSAGAAAKTPAPAGRTRAKRL